MDEIIFEKPPANGAGSHLRAPNEAEERIASALKARQGEYARCFTFPADQRPRANTIASAIRQGRRAAFKDGRYSSMTRLVDDEIRVYVAYDGPQR